MITEKIASTPRPGIEPGPPANAADALPLSYRGWFSSQPERLTTSPHHLLLRSLRNTHDAVIGKPPLLSLLLLLQLKKSQKGKVYVPRLEPTAPISLADRNHAHYPSRYCTIFKKRLLNDGLQAHMIPSTRESSEDVIYTYT